MKKFIAIIFAVCFVMSAFVFSVSADRNIHHPDNADYYEITDNVTVPGYFCRSLSQYQPNIPGVFATATFRNNTASTVYYARLITYAAIEYTDGSNTADMTDVDGYLGTDNESCAIITTLEVQEDDDKWPVKLYTDHYFYLNGSNVLTEYIEFVPGAFSH